MLFIALLDFGNARLVRSFGFRHACIQSVKISFPRFLQRFLIRSLGKAKGTTQQLIRVKRPLPLHALCFACGKAGRIGQIKAIKRFDLLRFQIARHSVTLHGSVYAGFVRLLRCQTLGGCLTCPAQPLLHIILQGFLPVSRHELSHIRLGTFGIQIQDLFKEAVRFLPFSVLQRHIAPLQQRGRVGAAGVLLHDHSLLHRFRLFVGIEHLAYTVDQILQEADLAHIVGLQHAQLLRQVIGIHVPIAGQKELAAVLLHQRQETAPLVLDPDGVKMRRLRTHRDHDLCGMEGGKDIRLILRTRLVLQSDPGEEHPPSLFGQPIIDILRQDAVPCALAVFVGLLIADKHIEGLFVLRGRQNAALNLRNLRRVLLILAARDPVGMLHGSQIVHILQEIVKAGSVAGRQPLIGRRILHILDTEPAKGTAPVRLRIGVVLLNDALIHRQRLVKLSDPAEVVAPVERGSPLLIAHLRQGHRRAAILADAKRFVCSQLDIPATHFTFDNCHVASLRYFSFSRISI